MENEVKVGQRWGLWVFDDSMYERFKITKIVDGRASGETDDGCPCIVGISRLLSEGERLYDSQ